MKRFCAILSLVLALSLCLGAYAEQTPATAAAETTAETTEPAAAETNATEEALAAYKALKSEKRAQKRLDALKEELAAFVAEGKLTQEQADLILQYYTEKLASRAEKAQKKAQKQGEKRTECQKTEGKKPGQQKTEKQQNSKGKQGQPGGKTPKTDAASGATKPTQKGK